MVECSVSLGERRVRFVDTHLGAGVPAAERVRQANLVSARADGAVVIAGDLNARSAVRGAARVGGVRMDGCRTESSLGTASPATNWQPGPRVAPPTQRLDYVLVRDSVEVVDAFVPTDWERWAGLSDHLPVVTHLRV